MAAITKDSFQCLERFSPIVYDRTTIRIFGTFITAQTTESEWFLRTRAVTRTRWSITRMSDRSRARHIALLGFGLALLGGEFEKGRTAAAPRKDPLRLQRSDGSVLAGTEHRCFCHTGCATQAAPSAWLTSTATILPIRTTEPHFEERCPWLVGGRPAPRT